MFRIVAWAPRAYSRRMDRPRTPLAEDHTVHDDAALAERGYAAVALACVLKLTATADELVPAVRTAIRGKRHVSPRLRDPPV